MWDELHAAGVDGDVLEGHPEVTAEADGFFTGEVCGAGGVGEVLVPGGFLAVVRGFVNGVIPGAADIAA